jgi:RNA polymerase sigma factor (sigma-70 family)
VRTAQLGRDGDAVAFAAAPRDVQEFCRALYPELVGALTLYCGTREVGEDLAQEALLRACAAWERVAAMANPQGWVFAAGFNLARSRTRRLLRQRRAYARAATERGSADPMHPDTTDAIAVRRAVAELPERQRRALVLRYYADLSVDDTASAMGCAAGTVKALTAQAIAGLRRAGLEVTDD